jgi:hypothetical protein
MARQSQRGEDPLNILFSWLNYSHAKRRDPSGRGCRNERASPHLRGVDFHRTRTAITLEAGATLIR